MVLQIIVNIKESVKKYTKFKQVLLAQKDSILSLELSQNSIKYVSFFLQKIWVS